MYVLCVNGEYAVSTGLADVFSNAVVAKEGFGGFETEAVLAGRIAAGAVSI